MNKKIMIVEDNKEFLEELEELLALSGYAVIAVSEPVSALKEARENRPDVILLDLKMPGKDGFQIADEIRGDSELMKTPIIIMTAYFKEDYLPLMNTCGVRKCLKKPFNPLDVIANIEEELLQTGNKGG